MLRRLAPLLCIAVLHHAAAQQPAKLPDRGGALVATTRTFAFYSDPRFNLHDLLVSTALSRDPPEPAAACLAGLPPEESAAFEHAREHYQALAGPGGNRLLLALRYRLAGFGDFGISDAAAVDSALTTLGPAAPAYEKCWWPTHDARNRRWIAALAALLEAHEDALAARLQELYGDELGRPLPVDVVSFGSRTGADSVVDPDHLLISSSAPANAGYAALEVVLHEASHTIFGPGHDGGLWTELEAAAKANGNPLPRDFWHVLLFYTTGSTVRARFAERGVDYRQYLYAQGLFDRSWPEFREPLERLWQPYLDGRGPRADALRQLVEALPTAPPR